MLLLIHSPPKNIYKEEKQIFKNNILCNFYLLISLLSHISFCFFFLWRTTLYIFSLSARAQNKENKPQWEKLCFRSVNQSTFKIEISYLASNYDNRVADLHRPVSVPLTQISSIPWYFGGDRNSLVRPLVLMLTPVQTWRMRLRHCQNLMAHSHLASTSAFAFSRVIEAIVT